MARAERLKAVKLRRISQSNREITVVLRDTAPGPVPQLTSTQLVSPLTGNRPRPTEAAPALPGDRTAGTVGPLKCLWYEAAQLTHLWRQGNSPGLAGWSADADAFCEVALTDDIRTTQATIFDDAAYVEYNGSRYSVLRATPIGIGDDEPYTLFVWLRGRVGQ